MVTCPHTLFETGQTAEDIDSPPWNCLDLCAGLGGFSAAFRDSDNWNVTTVDINPEFDPDITADVLELSPEDLPETDVLLAGPPCTRLSKAACWHEYVIDGVPQTQTTREHLLLMFHIIGLANALSPVYWFLENPQGKLPQFLGEPTGTVTYCQYGAEYQKRTHLWGDHPNQMDYRTCTEGDSCHTATPRSDDRHASDPLPDSAAERSKVTYELSRAICDTVESAFNGEQQNQQITLGQIK